MPIHAITIIGSTKKVTETLTLNIDSYRINRYNDLIEFWIHTKCNLYVIFVSTSIMAVNKNCEQLASSKRYI